MRKHIFLAAAAASMLAVSCQQTPKTVDWTKPTLSIHPSGDSIVYEYDKNGNQIFDGFYNHKYNDKNQKIESVVDGVLYKYEYDDKGNLISETTDDGSVYSYSYNEKNQLLSTSYKIPDVLDENTTFEYEGNKVIETQISINLEDLADVKVAGDTVITTTYYIDPDFKYDTLQIVDDRSKLFPYSCMRKSEWQMVCGKYQLTLTEGYVKNDDGYKLNETHSWEYNENGYVVKQILNEILTNTITEITYTAEGNKLTGSDGSVYYYLEK